jgi:hypothetical protein
VEKRQGSCREGEDLLGKVDKGCNRWAESEEKDNLKGKGKVVDNEEYIGESWLNVDLSRPHGRVLDKGGHHGGWLAGGASC